MSELVNKLKPDNFNNYIGNLSIRKKILDTLNKNNNTGLYYIYGLSGIGKTLFIELFCKENEIEVQHLDITFKEDIKDIKKQLKVPSLIPVCYIIKNIDLKRKNGTYKNTKFINFLNEKSDKIKNNLVFLTGNDNKVHKKIKNVEGFNFRKVQSKVILKKLKEIMIEKNFTVSDKTDDILLKIIEDSKCDIRTSIQIIEMMNISNKDKTKILKTRNNFNFIKNYKIEREQELFKSFGMIYNNKVSNLEKEKLYYNQPLLLPMAMYENYLKRFNKEDPMKIKVSFAKKYVTKYSDTKDKKHKIKTWKHYKSKHEYEYMKKIEQIAIDFEDYSTISSYENKQGFTRGYIPYISIIKPCLELNNCDTSNTMLMFPKLKQKTKDDLKYEKNKLPSMFLLDN